MIAINVNCVSVNTEIALLKAVFAKLSSSRRNVAASKLRDCVENLLRTVDCPVLVRSFILICLSLNPLLTV